MTRAALQHVFKKEKEFTRMFEIHEPTALHSSGLVTTFPNVSELDLILVGSPGLSLTSCTEWFRWFYGTYYELQIKFLQNP